MDPFEKLFQHLPEYQVIVCKRCQFAVVPAQVDSHVRSHHKTIPKSERQSIVETVATLSNIAQEPGQVQYPSMDSKPVDGLPVYDDGLRCVKPIAHRECNYICRERTGITRHCRQQHQWKNPRTRGGNRRGEEAEETGQIWEEDQRCQRFFKTGPWQRYFAVRSQAASESKRTDEPANREQTTQQGKTVLDQLFHRFEKAQRNRTPAARGRVEANPWLEHTRWESHLGQHREWAVRMIKPEVVEWRQDGVSDEASNVVDEEAEETESARLESEQALEQACQATAALIRQSYRASQIDIVGRPAMEYVNRRETGAPSSDRPFYSGQKVQTIRRYIDQFVKILRYIWRTAGVPDRPQYRLTHPQQTALEQFREMAATIVEEERGDPPHRSRRGRIRLGTACLSFWIAMFDHRLGDQEYENAVLSGLAVLGADGENGGWMPAINYTPILAAVITTMRAIVVRRAWRVRQRQIQLNIRNGIPKEYADHGVASVFDGVKKDVEKFMTMTAFGGHPTPINTIYTQKMYGMKIRYTTKAEGQVSWEGDDTVLIRKIKFSIGDIRSVVHGLLAVVREQLVEQQLLFPPSTNPMDWRPAGLPQFHVAQIRDNHATMDEGWSFWKDVRNEWPVDGERYMGMRLFEEGPVRERFVRRQSGLEIEYDDDAVAQYLRAVRKFKEKLIVLVHMSAGAPARSTELTSMQCENGKYARSQRGVFIDDGLVMFVTAYHKGYSASQSKKIVHRYVPHEVGEVVIYYLWFVRPFERVLQGLAYQQELFSSWLWEPEPEEEWGEDEEDDESDEGDGSEGPDSRPEDIEEWMDIDEEDEAEIVRARPAPAEARNCDGFWNTDRVRRVMKRETADLIGVPIGISDWRQVYPAIHREFAHDHSIRETLSQIYDQSRPSVQEEKSAEDSMAAIRAKQSGHSFRMEEDIYGRSLEQSPFTTIAEKDKFRRVSVDWHRFMHFPSAWQPDSRDPDVQRRIKQEQNDARVRQWERMRNIDVEAELRRLYRNPHARFRGAQRAALDLIVGGCPRLVIIMRTGGGKSLLFMLPAAASRGGVTIVVVPKIALQVNMKARCAESGIKGVVWSDDRAPPYDAQIVFVIAESAISQSFTDFMNAKRAAHQLERIVIDECHAILQSHDGWRPKVLQLRELAGRDTQVVCLTATLPPSKQETFLKRMDMHETTTKILRDVTVRPNIAYRIAEYEAAEEVEFLRELVEQKKAQYPPSDKIVIFCRTIDQVKEFAKELGCTAFWRTVGTEQEKAAIVEMLAGSEERVFTCTNALGEGIDAPGIRVVIHIGVIDSLDDYNQQSGRAGRDGVTTSEAIILRKVQTGRDGRRRAEQGWKVEAEMAEFLSGDRCQRVVMDEYMDGSTERSTCHPGEQFCHVCNGHSRKRVRVVHEPAQPAAKRVRREDEDDDDGGEVVAPTNGEARAPTNGEARAPTNRQDRTEEAAQQAQHSFEQNRAQYARITSQQREERIGQGLVAEQMDALFRRWRYGCSICRIRGRPSNQGHNWRKCPHEPDIQDRVQAIEALKGALRQVAWANGTMCCRQCWAPQATCQTYQPIDHTGRARFRKGKGACQYRGVLGEVVAVMLATRPDAGTIMEWVHEQAVRAGLAIQQSSGNRDDVAQAWFGSSIVQGEVEMSGMCHLFRSWAEREVVQEEGP